MAVRAGQILLDVNGFLVDRIQTGGVSNLNIPSSKVDELGNFHTVGIIRDIPDLSFSIDSTDVTTDIEAMMVGVAPSAVVAGVGGTPTPTTLDFASTKPIDVTSPFRAGNSVYNVVRGVVVPYLNLESVAYKYGLKANAQETFTLRGDAIYYIPGVPIQEQFVGGSATYNFTYGPAIVYHELGFAIYALSLWWSDPATGLTKRLFHGQDYTDTANGITLVNGAGACPNGAKLFVTYGTLPVTQATPSPPYYYGASTLTSTATKPAAIRSKDMDIFITVGGNMVRLTGVQSFDATWKVTIVNEEEFGNAHYVTSDFDIPDVSGTLTLKGVDPADVIAKVQEMAGVPTNEISGPLTSPPIGIEARLRNPDTHALLKTIWIPNATLSAPPVSGKAGQRLDQVFKFDSSDGIMQVFRGERIGGEV